MLSLCKKIVPIHCFIYNYYYISETSNKQQFCISFLQYRLTFSLVTKDFIKGNSNLKHTMNNICK